MRYEIICMSVSRSKDTNWEFGEFPVIANQSAFLVWQSPSNSRQPIVIHS